MRRSAEVFRYELVIVGDGIACDSIKSQAASVNAKLGREAIVVQEPVLTHGQPDACSRHRDWTGGSARVDGVFKADNRSLAAKASAHAHGSKPQATFCTGDSMGLADEGLREFRLGQISNNWPAPRAPWFHRRVFALGTLSSTSPLTRRPKALSPPLRTQAARHQPGSTSATFGQRLRTAARVFEMRGSSASKTPNRPSPSAFLVEQLAA